MQTNPTQYCSFCKKSQHEVETLIAGPDVAICNECIELCVDILATKESWRERTIADLERGRVGGAAAEDPAGG